MGRGFGDGIYDSDKALDYQATITNRIEREIAYWITPEQVHESGVWLSCVMSVIQVILLFEENDVRSSVYLQHETAVQRWREVFLRVWDGDWKGETISYPFDNPDYRKQHRPAVLAMFNCVESIAHFWANSDNPSTRIEPTPMPPEYSLPYFPVQGAWLLFDLMDLLRKDIIYRLSVENRNDALGFFTVHEEVPVAVDILALLADKFQTTPGITAQTVRNWRNTAMQIVDRTAEEYNLKGDSVHFVAFQATFDKLEAVAPKYPPYWEDEE